MKANKTIISDSKLSKQFFLDTKGQLSRLGLPVGKLNKNQQDQQSEVFQEIKGEGTSTYQHPDMPSNKQEHR